MIKFIKKVTDYLTLRHRHLTTAAIVTIATFLLTDSCKNTLQSEASFSKTFKSTDYILLDLYESFEANSPVGVINPDVVIIEDDTCNRMQIAKLILSIQSLKPAAIGVDHLFVNSQKNDSILINAINQCHSNIVLASELKYDTEFQKYSEIQKAAFSNSLKDITTGVTNIDEPSATPQNIVRRIFSTYTNKNSKEYGSFSFELIKKAKKKSCNSSNIPHSTYISFKGLDTYKFNWNDFINENGSIKNCSDYHELIENKIVLIGNTKDRSDMHMIPSEKLISGVELHACALYTYMNNKYLVESPKYLDILVAFICVFLFVLLLYYSNVHMGHFGNLIVRLTQTFVIFLFILIGYIFYINENFTIYVDFSTSIIMIGVSSFVFDIIRGLYGLLTILKNKLS